MKKYLTIAELAEQVDIPNSTCRRYLANFETFFVAKGGNRVKKYEETAVHILKRIKALYDEGLETNEVHNVLVNEFPLVISTDEYQGNQQIPKTPKLATSEDIAEIMNVLIQQKQFNEELLDQIKKQQEFIEKSIERRDKLLLESIRSLQEQKRIQIESHEINEKKGFFSRFFNKKKLT